MLEMHLTCPNCKKTFVIYDWQLWRDSEENESFQCPAAILPRMKKPVTA